MMITYVFLKGVKVKVGDTIRFINDLDLYKGDFEGFDKLIKPELGVVYHVRGFSDNGGFLLEEVRNIDVPTDVEGFVFYTEPGFATWRFEPANPLIAEVMALAKSKKKVNIKIAPEVIERVEEVLQLN